ncbi:hypothetical protein CC86DRAFT_403930 [Ophiobolus disseminans]|uniref:Uncharacterized protein n=1 Tax=Ophiobolus disseminans TaxID=1469910 RepID=A0A6A7A8Z2_9PLEO|nr:hypothetical protein CC86DRAFT_403930 [Ophiobolus disseminans]
MVSIKIATIAAVLSSALSVTATNFHVNRGCIFVDGTNVCAPNTISVNDGNAEIEAKLDQPQHCKVTFTWPKDYGDVFFGADNCFYDSNGANINGQCCR